MPTPTPLVSGHYYHIYARGNNRENIFFEERNYQHFLQLYAKYIDPVADTFAYCLMRNHFHLLVRIKTGAISLGHTHGTSHNANLTSQVFTPQQVSQSFSNLLNSHAKAINKVYYRTGSLFQKGFGRLLVESDRYFLTLLNYIHRNPQKHGFVTDFRDWPYSSYHLLLSDKVTQLKRGEVLNWLGNREQFETFHRTAADIKPINHLIVDDDD